MSYFHGSVIESLADGVYAGSFPLMLNSVGNQHFLFEGLSREPVFHFANSEYVVRPPAQAVVLGTTPVFETAALDYGDQWLSVQFHPEMRHDVIAVDFKFIRPDFVERFYPLSSGLRLLYNFLRGTAMLE